MKRGPYTAIVNNNRLEGTFPVLIPVLLLDHFLAPAHISYDFVFMKHLFKSSFIVSIQRNISLNALLRFFEHIKTYFAEICYKYIRGISRNIDEINCNVIHQTDFIISVNSLDLRE